MATPTATAAQSAAARRALTAGGYRLPAPRALEAIAATQYPPAFAALGLADASLAALAALGFADPTPIQAQAMPTLLDGHDVVGQAQTGTGKTVAFGLPLMERIDAADPSVQAVVLVPTRELAQQVFEVLAFLGSAHGLRTLILMGGRRLAQDFETLQRHPQIVVGTPGRVIDHLERGSLNLSHVRVAVLDEADRMLDIGFEPDIRRILRRSPAERQTALFSATIPTAIKTLIWRYMREPVHIRIEPEQPAAPEIRQEYAEVAERDKLAAFQAILPELGGRTLVFCNMKVTVDRLVSRLRARGVPAEAIHGDLPQSRRDSVMAGFRSGDVHILVATNVAARGLDIPDVTHVVNFDLPQAAEEYVHRIGRTGRAGREGSAITFVAEWDLGEFEAIKKLVGGGIARRDLGLYGAATAP